MKKGTFTNSIMTPSLDRLCTKIENNSMCKIWVLIDLPLRFFWQRLISLWTWANFKTPITNYSRGLLPSLPKSQRIFRKEKCRQGTKMSKAISWSLQLRKRRVRMKPIREWNSRGSPSVWWNSTMLSHRYLQTVTQLGLWRRPTK